MDWYSISPRAGHFGARAPVGGARFFAPDLTGPGAKRASFTMPTGSFPEVKQPGSGVDHLPSSTDVKEWNCSLPLLPLYGCIACNRVAFAFTFRIVCSL